jgi:poly(3-hydroxybutyrate) depolymerase
MKITTLLILAAALCFGQTDSFMNQSAMRNFIIHAPAGTLTPALVINMHGLGSNALQEQLLTGFDAIADREKFIVVYPNGISNTWDITGDKDVAFISALIDTMNARYHIDLKRVFATGMSMGGYMSHRLACALSNRIAAIGPVSGLNATYNCVPSRAVPVLQIHGTADSVVKYSNVAATITGWVNRNGCPATVVTTNPYPASNPNSVVKKEAYGPCRDSSEVILLTVNGGGHTWPGVNWGGATKDINASEEIWVFFKKHPMPGPAGIIADNPANQSRSSMDGFGLTAQKTRMGARISYCIPHSGKVTITVYNTFGRTVWKQASVEKSAGNHVTIWNGLNSNGHIVSCGMYWISLNVNDFGKSSIMKTPFSHEPPSIIIRLLY